MNPSGHNLHHAIITGLPITDTPLLHTPHIDLLLLVFEKLAKFSVQFNIYH